MVRQGDELLQSSLGNNNAYTQDNPLSWLSWQPGAREREFLEFARKAFALRREHPALRRSDHWTGAVRDGQRDVTWLQPEGGAIAGVQFGEERRRSFGAWIAG